MARNTSTEPIPDSRNDACRVPDLVERKSQSWVYDLQMLEIICESSFAICRSNMITTKRWLSCQFITTVNLKSV